MDLQSKTARKRVANFTADEKALLAQLIKKRPIIESRITDGKSIPKKQAAWESLTQEFNCNANLHKRETATLKRAWDNMKAVTRKARATERGNLIRTGGGPQAPPPPPQQGAIISLVEEISQAAPMMINEVYNAFDSDGAILNIIENSSQELDCLEENICTENIASASIDFVDIIDMEAKEPAELPENKENVLSPLITGTPKGKDWPTQKFSVGLDTTDQVRKPTDYIRREAVFRIRNLEHKKKNEMQLFDKQLTIENLKERALIFEEEQNQILQAKQLALIEKQLANENIRQMTLLYEEEKNKLMQEKAKIDLEKSKIELEELKKSCSK